TLDPEGASERFDDLLREDRRRGIALDDAPLWRLALVTLGPGDRRLIWTYSHAILDVPSAARVLTEVIVLHEALREGLTIRLDEPRPHQEHVAWLGGEIREKRGRAADFFRTMLA